MLPKKSSRVAVIGPFFNDERHVEAWLNQFACQTHQQFELYVVDDGSSDQTVRRLGEVAGYLALPVQILSLGKNVGPSAARNAGLKKAVADGADLFLLLDSDARVAPDWIQRHVDFHRKSLTFGILGGAIKGLGETAIGRADGYCSWFTAVPFSPSGEVKRLHLSTTNWSMKRRVIEKVGYFDERLATGEDVAFCRAAQKAGERLFFHSDIVMIHLDRNDRKAAAQHHYRWGLHSYYLSLQGHGGYYGALKKWDRRQVALAVPAIAFLNVLLILAKYSRYQKRVWFYLPWICYLKFWNALGVYRGFINPSLCLRPGTSPSKLNTNDNNERSLSRAAV